MESYTLAYEGIVSLVLLSLTVLLSYVYGTRTYSTWSQLGIPGPKPIPFLGNVLQIRKEGIIKVLPSWSKQYGKTFGVYFMRRPLLLTTDLDIVKEVFVKDFNSYTDRGLLSDNPIMTDVMGSSLFFANGQQWRRQRHTLSPTFSASKLKMMGVFISRCCDNLVQVMERSVKTGKALDVKQTFGSFTMDVIAGTGFGVETNSLVKDDEPFLKNVSVVVKSLNFITIPAIIADLFPALGHVMRRLGISLIPQKESAFLVEAFRTMIEERKHSKSATKSQDLLQLMMDAESNDPDMAQKVDRKRLTTDEIISQCLVFFTAGYETTATTLQFLSYLLTMNPEKQDKLYEEIMAAVGDADPSYDNVMSITYLDSCIRETLRIFPPGTLMDRKVQQQKTVKGVTLPVGASVGLNIVSILMDEDIFPQPQKFLPERFEDADHPIPPLVREIMFGAGPRQCIGMRLALYEAKMAVVSTLRKFRFVKIKETPTEITLSPLLILPMPEKPIFVGVERRQM